MWNNIEKQRNSWAEDIEVEFIIFESSPSTGVKASICKFVNLGKKLSLVIGEPV